MKWQSTKRYTHAEGLSCAFRQWRASSRCRLLHAYSLSFEFTFECTELDERNWCADFGDLKALKAWLHDTFDHTTCISQDDPELSFFQELYRRDVLDLRIVTAVGCEKFSEMALNKATELINEKYGSRVRVVSVEVREHEGNSARCIA